MVSVGGLCFDHPVQIEVPKTGKEKMAKSAWSDSSNFEFWNQGTEAILMQYIGLKDKSGKEICEGDIVRDTYDNSCGQIQYGHKEYAGFFIRYSKPKTDLGHSWVWSMFDSKDLEIIGNIYENPELLDKKE
jgi:uncharacterized phage protein (TIGR01671 family)